MSSAYDQLLEATIRHVENLQARGVRQLPVSPATLRALSQPAPRVTPPPVPAPPLPRISPRSEPASNLVAPDPGLVTLPIMATPSGGDERPSRSLAEKEAAFTELRSRVLVCMKCPHLAASRQTVVFGVGNVAADLMFVGEAPGADEDAQGEPFVGKAGQLLTKIIETMGRQREEVYIGNILKCRPDTPGQSAGNRKPTPEEMATCLPYLHEQIDLIQPKVLVALGATAVEGLLGKTVGITKLRGHWQTYRGIPLMPTYHPAYLLRNQSLAAKRQVWEDMLQVMEKLGMPISDKQRGFFLRGTG